METLLSKRVLDQNNKEIAKSTNRKQEMPKPIAQSKQDQVPIVSERIANKSDAMINEMKQEEKARILSEAKSNPNLNVQPNPNFQLHEVPKTSTGYKVNFGGSKPNVNPPVAAAKEQQKPSTSLFGDSNEVERLTHRGIDNAVDKTFENEKFQENLRKGAREGAIQAAGGPSNPLSNLAGKAAEKTVQNSSVQNAMKDQVKKEGKEKASKKMFNFF